MDRRGTTNESVWFIDTPGTTKLTRTLPRIARRMCSKIRTFLFLLLAVHHTVINKNADQCVTQKRINVLYFRIFRDGACRKPNEVYCSSTHSTTTNKRTAESYTHGDQRGKTNRNNSNRLRANCLAIHDEKKYTTRLDRREKPVRFA